MERSQVIDKLWADSPLFLNREEFERRLEGWEIHEVQGAEALAGVVLTNGPVFHFAKFDPAFPVTREILRRWPGGLIEKYGYAETSTPKEDTRQQRFNERLGFERVGENEFDVIYRITRSRI